MAGLVPSVRRMRPSALPKHHMRKLPAAIESAAQARRDPAAPSERRAGIAAARHPVGPDMVSSGAGMAKRCRPD